MPWKPGLVLVRISLPDDWFGLTRLRFPREKPMNFNFFDWLRDGVRQSVLLGVSDAVEQIGTPDNSSELNPEIAALLGDSAGGTATATKRKRVARKGTTQKRLGKSLQELNPPS
jgi:hypothetical protein